MGRRKKLENNAVEPFTMGDREKLHSVYAWENWTLTKYTIFLPTICTIALDMYKSFPVLLKTAVTKCAYNYINRYTIYSCILHDYMYIY